MSETVAQLAHSSEHQAILVRADLFVLVQVRVGNEFMHESRTKLAHVMMLHPHEQSLVGLPNQAPTSHLPDTNTVPLERYYTFKLMLTVDC